MSDLQFPTIEGVRCAVHDGGPRSGEAVVFVHGNPGAIDDWAALLPAIEGFSRVVAMDMPGYGRAERPRDFDYTVRGYARYLGRLLDHLSVERAHLVLHDFGGPWGLRWMLDHPRRVASLSLIDSGLMPGYRWHRYARIWQTPVLGEIFQLLATPGVLRASLNRDNPRPLPRGFTDRVAAFSDWGHKRAVLRLYRASRQVAAIFPEAARTPVDATLPVCVLWGERDPYLPVRYAQLQREFFPQAEVHVLPGLGHWPFVEAPEAILAPLQAFLRRRRGLYP
ncbi:alpha/beta fold hydrolase [Luteimonas aquatica]|uniref:alpha/beta fold hydrolase n=1 Tax=Luteimonas aquatica TaxID=450364 RepID=UPI001F57ECA7|nr:alpha/beta fold hydrolase [Luteimonas aquatica]